MPVQTRWNLASVTLQDAYTDFILSRQAMNCTPATLDFYRYTAGVFLSWAESQGVTMPDQVTARYVRQFLAGLNKSDRTLHANARAIKTLLKFWHTENYIPSPVVFDMPHIAKNKLPRLTAEQLRQVIKVCNVRDRAIVLFMADSGLRRAEVCALNWGDVDMQTGLVIVKRGKGGKARSVAIGATVRRALLKYRRTLTDRTGTLFQTRTGTRFTGTGLLLVFRRLSQRTGIHITPHAMRRSYVTLALEAGQDVLHIQRQLGHASLEMTSYYAALDEIDMQAAKNSPVDRL